MTNESRQEQTARFIAAATFRSQRGRKRVLAGFAPDRARSVRLASRAAVVAAVATLVSVPGPSVAANESGWYLGLSGGPQWRQKAVDEKGETTFDTGWAASAFLGHRFDNLRVEGEFSYMVNNNDTTKPNPAFGIPKEASDGDVDFRSLFLNVLYDVPLAGWPIRPYLGAGIGGYKASINGLTTKSLRTIPPEFGGPLVVNAESSWNMGWQLRAGVSYPLSPRTEVSLGYRYFHGVGLAFDQEWDGSRIHDSDPEIHELEVGLRLNL